MESRRICRKTAVECLEAIWPSIECTGQEVKQVKVRYWGQMGMECEFSVRRRNFLSKIILPKSKPTHGIGVDCVGGYDTIETKSGKLTYVQIESYLRTKCGLVGLTITKVDW